MTKERSIEDARQERRQEEKKHLEHFSSLSSVVYEAFKIKGARIKIILEDGELVVKPISLSTTSLEVWLWFCDTYIKIRWGLIKSVKLISPDPMRKK